jgi:TonB family protein
MMRNFVLVLVLIVPSSWKVIEGQTPAPRSPSVSLPDGRTLTMPSIDTKVWPASTPGTPLAPGSVDVETVVSDAGSVAQVRVAKSTDPSGALDRACVAALRQWRFHPSTNNGRPLPSLVLVRFTVAAPASTEPAAVTALLASLEYAPGPQEWTQTPPPYDVSRMSQTAAQATPGMKLPMVIREVVPRYSPEGLRAKIQGQVVVDVVVAPDGTVGAAKIRKSLDAANGLDEAALIAARYWLFTPGMRDGVPVPMGVTLVLEFRLR